MRDALARLMSKVQVTENGCWQFTGCLKKGYGWMGYEGGQKHAHLVSYLLYRGPIPEGMQIDHICHTQECRVPALECPHRRCVNPSHLQAVSRSANTKRGNTGRAAGDRELSKTHCPKGHPYDEENTIIDHNRGKPCRRCRTCRLEKNRQWWSINGREWDRKRRQKRT